MSSAFCRPVRDVTRNVLQRLVRERGYQPTCELAKTTRITLDKALDGMPLLLKAASSLDDFAASQTALAHLRTESSV